MRQSRPLWVSLSYVLFFVGLFIFAGCVGEKASDEDPEDVLDAISDTGTDTEDGNTEDVKEEVDIMNTDVMDSPDLSDEDVSVLCGGQECNVGNTCCNNTCVDTSWHPVNCGGCNIDCDPGEACDQGQCVVNCQVHLTNCDGGCVNSLSEREHCGGCNTSCDPGYVCSVGYCALSCQQGLTNCGGECVNTDHSIYHCGGCGLSCDPGQVCSLGTCAVSCQVGLTNCSGSCVDKENDALHCGMCFGSCEPGDMCVGGQCTGQRACGDGVINNMDEACDDGNMDNTDDCIDTCQIASCGDGFVQSGVENCDDGNTENTDSCLDTCEVASCSDGFVQLGVEECEDGNMDNSDSCIDTCLNASCGDSHVYLGVEECDDGNTMDGDGCSDICEFQDVFVAADTVGDVGVNSSITIGMDGFPVVSYYGGSNDGLRVLKCGDSACLMGNTIASPDSGFELGVDSSITIGTNGFPVVSYYDHTNGDLKVLTCGDATCMTGNSVTAPDTAGVVGRYSSIAIGPGGFPVISYYDSSNGDLKVLNCGDASCTFGNSITTPDTPGDVGSFTSLAIGVDGYPVISYHDYTFRNLLILKCGDATCTAGSSITSPDSQGDVGEYTSLIIGNDGFPVVSYYDSTNSGLKVLKCGDAFCLTGNSITSPDVMGTVGWDTSIAIAASGFPIVSYSDRSNGDLKVLRCGDAVCNPSGNSISSPATSGTVGEQTSLVIDANGIPMISHYDLSNKDLNIAYLPSLR